MDYKLSASLTGHEDDVRGVAFASPDLAVSASRDGTVRQWRRTSSSPPTYDDLLLQHGQTFVNCLDYIPPSAEFSEGLIISGGQEAIIELRQPGRTPQDNADALLLGHAGNVCALDISEDGKTIISGSWDTEARVWAVGKWETLLTLTGHTASVWAVLAYDQSTFITGCADKLIRIFNNSGKVVKTVRGSTDVVRALCRLPTGHPSGAQFASAGNDATIRLWTLEGLEVAQLHGHENFIYSLSVLPGGELVSAGEDRTLRIWKGTQCVQTITHPAISVWSVAVCKENGDIVTGASDKIVRIFSRSKDRQADEAGLREFENSVSQSSIPQQALGGINKTDLPGPDFLTSKSGTKEGQVQMIKETNGNVSAYTWSTAANQWINVGTVVDAAGAASGKKISYQGQDWDYVFDVDISEGQPALKLPYNVNQNAWEVAQKFITDNELPISYLDQVANFITTNSAGASLGQSSSQQQQPSALGSDPWGTESRYRPGDVGSSVPPSAPSRPKALPQTQYLSIATANYPMIEKKIREFNATLIEQGRKDLSLNPPALEILSATIKQVELAAKQPSESSPASGEGIDIALQIATAWPVDMRLPGLDLLRLLSAASENTVWHTSAGDKTLVDRLASSDVFAPESSPNNTMLAVRTLANLFMHEAGRTIADGEFDKIHILVQPFLASSNRNLIVALTTLYINYAVLLQAAAPNYDGNRALTLLDDLTKVINTAVDSEALYRALVAAGTLLALGQDFRDVAKEALDFDKSLARAEKVGVEPRIKHVVAEMRDELRGS